MQLLHVEETGDRIVVDCFVEVDATVRPPTEPTCGLATLVLCRPDRKFLDVAARMRVHEWVDEGVVLGVEIHRHDPVVHLDLRDQATVMYFDVASLQ